MPIDYVVAQGDCIDSIALRHGFFPDTLWNHGKNSELKQLRKDPNVLFPGDRLHIPDRQIREVDGATEKLHRFQRKGVPAKLHLRFLKPKDLPPPEEETPGGDEDAEGNYEEPEINTGPQEMEPIANAPFRLMVDGIIIEEGQTDGDGQVKVSIPPNAAQGVFTFYPGTKDERAIPLSLGNMDPVETMIGVRKRLTNLGYLCVINNDSMTPELKAVITRFQKDNGLTENGKADDATRAKLKEAHGC